MTLPAHQPPRRVPTTAQNERYTTSETLARVKSIAGVAQFDLDVAACWESHHAPVWYGWQDADRTPAWFVDGLVAPWRLTDKGRQAVFCNPPFDALEAWVTKAWAEMESSTKPRCIAMLAPCNRTEQEWWQRLVEPSRDEGVRSEARSRAEPVRLTTHFLPGRTRYGNMADPEGKLAGSPPFGSVVLLWR